LTADQGRLNDTDALIVLSVGKGAAAYLTRRFGADALSVLEDALNQHGETYAHQTTHGVDPSRMRTLENRYLLRGVSYDA